MKQLILFCTLILFATTGLAAKQEKTLICHVGNEMGPNGEVYDPACVPGENNDNFCADAGKIDLIVVAKAAKHLNNDSHSWEGISDYEPSEVGASGDDTEDSDGNGIDDGCEPAEECPCWDEIELLGFTVENQYIVSCDSYTWGYPNVVLIQAFVDGNAFTTKAYNSDWRDPPGCNIHYPNGEYVQLIITDEEANVCLSQMYDRCVDLGRPVAP
jgi:hypothetical protein